MFFVVGGAMFGCWMAAYALMIVKGFRERTYGMPAPCLFLNITWEVTLGVVHPPPDVRIQIFALGWALIDCVILYQYCRYGRRHFPLDQRLFWPTVLFGLVAGCAFNFVFLDCLGDRFLRYGALLSQLFMSYRYIEFLLARGNLLGQSLPIALCKLVGTFCAGILNYPGPPYYPHHEGWVDLCTALIFALDLTYVLLVVRVGRRVANIAPQGEVAALS
jgi:hypothetical protein